MRGGLGRGGGGEGEREREKDDVILKKKKKKSINHSSRTGIRVGISSWEKGRKWKRLFFI